VKTDSRAGTAVSLSGPTRTCVRQSPPWPRHLKLSVRDFLLHVVFPEDQLEKIWNVGQEGSAGGRDWRREDVNIERLRGGSLRDCAPLRYVRAVHPSRLSPKFVQKSPYPRVVVLHVRPKAVILPRNPRELSGAGRGSATRRGENRAATRGNVTRLRF